MVALKPIAESQFLCLIAGKRFFFNEVSAPGLVKDSFVYQDGQTGRSREQVTYGKLENLTVKKFYDPVQDSELLQFLHDLDGVYADEGFTFSIQPVLGDVEKSIVPGTTAIIYTGCQVKSIKEPAVNTAGTNGAMLEFEIVPYERSAS